MKEQQGGIVIREVFPDKDPMIHSQVLNLRNQLLRQPIGLDLFQEDLSQEKNHVTMAATITTTCQTTAKSDDNNAISSSPVEEDHIDNDNICNKEKVVGCIMLAPKEGEESTLKVRQMAVSPDFQGKGLGSMLVTKAEETARDRGKTRLYVHGRTHAVGFYLKKGFSKVKDEEFIELGIPHYALEKSLI